jgi:hypothetical protein
MRSRDVVCFNPLIYHCCTDPTTHGVKKISCYVSEKTCNTQNSHNTWKWRKIMKWLRQ